MSYLKINKSNLAFSVFVIIFIAALAFTLYARGGKDLKVDIYGAQQTLNKQSPYKNPGGNNDLRPLFRYAPGFAIMVYPFILDSKPYRIVNTNLEIDGIKPSVFAWYFFKILLLAICAIILLKLIPCISKEESIRNLKISFILSAPLIGYELANGQNKIVALFFMLVAIWYFKENRLFASALSFCLAMTVYIPLCFFILYFVIRKKAYIIHFIAAIFVVFIFLPSLIFGFNYNIYLLKQWFLHMSPFCLADNYTTYTDLRISSQSLPSAIGRIFVSGRTFSFKYLISPEAVHMVIKLMTMIILLISCAAAWKRTTLQKEGLCYIIFLILAMILPQYSIYYMWSWALAIYFIIFNYISFPDVSRRKKQFLLILAAVLFVSTILICIRKLSFLSVLFWGTTLVWAGISGMLIKQTRAEIKNLPKESA